MRSSRIYFARAGEALIEHLYKADADLSSLGWEYADKLAEFVERKRSESKDVTVKLAREGKLERGAEDDEPGSGPGEEGKILEVRCAPRLLPSCKAPYRLAHTTYALPIAIS